VTDLVRGEICMKLEQIDAAKFPDAVKSGRVVAKFYGDG
jgi:hypothetical protein